MFDAAWLANLVNSPLGHLSLGAALAGVTWKAFERIQAVLNPDLNLRLALWLLDRTASRGALPNWPQNVASIFDVVFGRNLVSWRSFLRSAAVTFTIVVSVGVYIAITDDEPSNFWDALAMAPFIAVINIIPDYISLVATRTGVRAIVKRPNVMVAVSALALAGVVCAGAVFVTAIGAINAVFSLRLPNSPFVSYLLLFPNLNILGVSLENYAVISSIIAAAIGLLWMMLFISSAGLIRVLAHSPRAVILMCRLLDVENKPLQSMGLVAGIIIAVVVWVLSLVSHLVQALVG